MIEIKKLPTLEYLKECFKADFESGILYWKKRPLSHFKNEHAYNIWNAKFSYKQANSKSNGYAIC